MGIGQKADDRKVRRAEVGRVGRKDEHRTSNVQHRTSNKKQLWGRGQKSEVSLRSIGAYAPVGGQGAEDRKVRRAEGEKRGKSMGRAIRL